MRAAPPTALRVAVACSGLGHIQRGIEAWAADLGTALRRRAIPCVLFGGAAFPAGETLACLRRTGAGARLLARSFRHLGGWRYGLGSPYEAEQLSFALRLWWRVRSEFDILHVQDPLIGRVLDLAYRRGISRARVILANGTDEKPEVLRRFTHLQQLTPAMAADWQTHRPAGQKVYAVPNFIDLAAYRPGDRVAARRQLGLPADSLIVLSCAAIRSFHKRMDVLVREFAAAMPHLPARSVLVIAGGREAETDRIIADATAALGERVRFLVNFPRPRMAELYRAADLFVLPSLHETFGIVLLEALASGLPAVCHDAPGFRYVAGSAGHYDDLAAAGAIARSLLALASPEARAPLAQSARPHVAAHFSEEVVIGQVLDMYRAVAGEPAAGGAP